VRKVIQHRHDSTAKLFDLGERMGFTTAIGHEKGLTDSHLYARRSEVPRADGSQARQRVDKVLERYSASGAHTRSGPDRRVERVWITGILGVHHDVTRN
jgi:hypothetical protein